MPYSKLLINAFGGGPLKDIAEIVKDFDFSKVLPFESYSATLS